MSNIYVPIDFSNVKNVIPPEQEIIYSTYARVEQSGGVSYTGRGISHSTTKWLTHLLITPKGLAFNVHDKHGSKACYVLFHLVSFYRGTLVTTASGKDEDIIPLRFTLVRKTEYEKKDTFKKRSKEFQSFLRPFRTKLLLDCVKAIYSEFENNPDYTLKDYLLSYEYPLNTMAFDFLKKFIKEGMTLDELIDRYTKISQKY